MIKIAINGLGRIGRPTLRKLLKDHSGVEVAAVNDLTDNATLAHLLKYDSVYGIYDKPVDSTDSVLIVDNKEIQSLSEPNPENLPWKELGVDIVLECSGRFTDLEGANKHLQAGAKKVIISAPCQSQGAPHFILGVNEDKYDAKKDNVMSMGSCSTNALAPMAKVLHDNLIIKSGLMTTVHSYTNDQRLLDLPHKDLRRSRSAGESMIPTTTGAAIAAAKVIPELKGKIHGLSVRVPTPIVSLMDFTVSVEKTTDAKEVNDLFKSAAKEFKKIIAISELPLVSIDYKGDSHSVIIDTLSTMVMNGNLVKVLGWYDNEWAYACRLAEFCEFMGRRI